MANNKEKANIFTFAATEVREIRHFHMCGAIGGGAKGFNEGEARVGNMVAKFRCIGSIDVDAAANRDFQHRIGINATTLDLFDRDQYIDFHDKEPPKGWREATPDDIRRAAGYERPHIVFTSPPCKGFSGLLAEGKSHTAKYQALNRLTVRGIWLMMEAWADDPPELVLLENVPRIANRGRHLLDQIGELLRHYGYAVAETTHDCGELGGLAQSRKRFLLVARHQEKVPPFLYEPEKKRLQGVGTILDRMPLPGDPSGGPMHRIPSLHWKTWVRLAFVEAGSDWRSLNNLAIQDGNLRDYLIVPNLHNCALGVRHWNKPAGVVAGASRPMNGAFSVADPRHAGPEKHSNEFRVVRWDQVARAVTGAHGSGQCVADPRSSSGFGGKGKYIITPYGSSANTVIASSTTGNGAFAVADPRPNMQRGKGDHYLTGGHYGVVPWSRPSGAVSGSACQDNGSWSVADPRIELPPADKKLIARIISEDGTWHRPFTTLELAALQSLVDPEEQLELDGMSDSAWRERIGNAVPPAAAKAIASEMGRTLLLAWSGETFQLSSTPIWVRQVAVALSLNQRRD